MVRLLAFYLASWGMYRGSSFVLQKDYTIYSGIVDCIFNSDKQLWDLRHNARNGSLNEPFQNLSKNIEEDLGTIKKSINEHSDLKRERRNQYNTEHISAKLVTKIILGTVGCIPAYDTYFMDGLSGETLIQKKYNDSKSFQQCLEFYLKHKNEIDSLIDKLNKNYTPMKIIDMYFWKIGYEKNKNKKGKKL